MALDAAWTAEWMRAAAAMIGENRRHLNDLDRAIGDGDHGENLDRGFRAIVDKLDAGESFETPAAVFKMAAMTLMSSVGGAAGPLYGTAFLRASTAVKDEAELGPDSVASLLEAARDGIVTRGKAEPGDKTMIDAWTPAVEAAKGSSGSAVDALAAAADAATKGAAATDELTARKGRASYLGERSAGHRDPGAESSAYILGCAAKTASSRDGAP